MTKAYKTFAGICVHPQGSEATLNHHYRSKVHHCRSQRSFLSHIKTGFPFYTKRTNPIYIDSGRWNSFSMRSPNHVFYCVVTTHLHFTELAWQQQFRFICVCVQFGDHTPPINLCILSVSLWIIYSPIRPWCSKTSMAIKQGSSIPPFLDITHFTQCALGIIRGPGYHSS